jgi:hypothetical protein
MKDGKVMEEHTGYCYFSMKSEFARPRRFVLGQMMLELEGK